VTSDLLIYQTNAGMHSHRKRVGLLCTNAGYRTMFVDICNVITVTRLSIINYRVVLMYCSNQHTLLWTDIQRSINTLGEVNFR